jgi:hypothetical protein
MSEIDGEENGDGHRAAVEAGRGEAEVARAEDGGGVEAGIAGGFHDRGGIGVHAAGAVDVDAERDVPLDLPVVEGYRVAKGELRVEDGRELIGFDSASLDSLDGLARGLLIDARAAGDAENADEHQSA